MFERASVNERMTKIKINKNGKTRLCEEKQANELWVKYWNIEHSKAGEKERKEVCTFVGVVVLLNEMFELGVKCKGKVPYHMILQVWSKHEMYAMRNKQNKVEKTTSHFATVSTSFFFFFFSSQGKMLSAASTSNTSCTMSLAWIPLFFLSLFTSTINFHLHSTTHIYTHTLIHDYMKKRFSLYCFTNIDVWTTSCI